jgi:hypothetical protein
MAFSMSEIRSFQRVSMEPSNRPIGLDLTYVMLRIMNQHNLSQKLAKTATKYLLGILRDDYGF